MIEGINNIKSLEELTQTLVAHAVRHKGKDNITLVSIQSDVDSDETSDILLAEVVRTFDSKSGNVVENTVQTQVVEESSEEKVKSIQPKSIQAQPINIETKEHKTSYNKWLLSLLFVSIALFVILLIIKVVLN